MLIICNGAFKSGSTWLFNIVNEMVDTEQIPDEFLNQAWVNPSLKLERIPEFIDQRNLNSNYITKTHLFPDKCTSFFINKPSIKILLLERDFIDTINSIYMHHIREKTIKTSFTEFYWGYGRFTLHNIWKYNNGWRKSNCDCCFLKYSDLKSDFNGSVLKIASFLEFNEKQLSGIDFTELKEKTTKDSLKERYKKIGGDPKFFEEKKKIVISEDIIEDVLALESGKKITYLEIIRGKLKRKWMI
jgi:hypothetical protein